MEGWVIKVDRDGAPKCHYVLSGLTVCNSKLKRLLNVPKPTSLIFVFQSRYRYIVEDDVKGEMFLVFEDKGEAKEFLSLLKRFQALDEILYWETYKTSEGFAPLKLSLQKVSAKSIVYADFDQVMESFDGFEERMEEAAKKLA